MKKIPSTKRETAAAFLKKVQSINMTVFKSDWSCCQTHESRVDTSGDHFVTRQFLKGTACALHLLIAVIALSLQGCHSQSVCCCQLKTLTFPCSVFICMWRAGQPCTAPVCSSCFIRCHVACRVNLFSGSVVAAYSCLPGCGLAHISNKNIYICPERTTLFNFILSGLYM